MWALPPLFKDFLCDNSLIWISGLINKSSGYVLPVFLNINQCNSDLEAKYRAIRYIYNIPVGIEYMTFTYTKKRSLYNFKIIFKESK